MKAAEVVHEFTMWFPEDEDAAGIYYAAYLMANEIGFEDITDEEYYEE